MIGKRKLVFIYYAVEGNQEIIDSDLDRFYADLLSREGRFNEEGIFLQKLHSPSAESLNTDLKSLFKEPFDEFYLHFNGHGKKDGIPYGDWLLKGDNLAIMADDPKVKFCFFSSCQSADLAKLVAGREIPVVIGTMGDNDISNNFVIEFQKSFYENLLDKKSFESAFEKASTDVETSEKKDLSKVLTRGTFALDDLESPDLGKPLQIIFNEEEEAERHLIYPTLWEQIKKATDKGEKQILLSYSDDFVELENFEKKFVEDGWRKTYDLFLLNKEDLEGFNTNDFQQFVQTEDWKIFFLIESEPAIFKEETLKKMFNYTGEAMSQFAVVHKPAINIDDFKANASFNEQINDCSQISFSSLNELFKNSEFDKFLSELEVSSEMRMSYIRKFPCSPQKVVRKVARGLEKILKKKIEEPQNYIQIFFAPKINERLFNFVINNIKNFLKREEEIIISDFSFSENVDAKLSESLKVAFKKNYPNNSLLDLQVGLQIWLYPLIPDGQIIVFRTNFDDPEKLKGKVIEFLAEVRALPVANPKKPTFIFFINNDNFSFKEDETMQFPVAKTNFFEAITSTAEEEFKTKLEDWADNIRGDDSDFDEIIDLVIEKYDELDFEINENKCPSSVIGIACEKFKIPQGQFLKI